MRQRVGRSAASFSDSARRPRPCLLGGTLTSDVCLLLPQETLTLGTREAATSAVGARGVEPKPSVTPPRHRKIVSAPVSTRIPCVLTVCSALLVAALGLFDSSRFSDLSFLVVVSLRLVSPSSPLLRRRILVFPSVRSTILDHDAAVALQPGCVAPLHRRFRIVAPSSSSFVVLMVVILVLVDPVLPYLYHPPSSIVGIHHCHSGERSLPREPQGAEELPADCSRYARERARGRAQESASARYARSRETERELYVKTDEEG